MADRIPTRHWRSCGDDPLPTPAEAMDEPFSAFPSWFLRLTCDRCGKDRLVSQVHAPWKDRTLRDILARARHDGCGGLAGKAELLTGVEGVSSVLELQERCSRATKYVHGRSSCSRVS